MGPEIDTKRRKIESSREEHKVIEFREKIEISSEHNAIESGEKTESSIKNTEESDAKAKALVCKATESGALDYSCFPRSWLGSHHTPMIACEGSENYQFGLKIASFALECIKDEDPVNDGKTFEVVCVDKVAILFRDHYLVQFTVREVVANADAPPKIIQSRVHFPNYYPDCRDAEVCQWRWFSPSLRV